MIELTKLTMQKLTFQRILIMLEEIITLRGAAQDYPELAEIRDIVHSLRVNSKLGAINAFDAINKTSQFVVAVDSKDNIKVFGTSTDAFDLELAFGIIGRAKKNVNKEILYNLFLRVMDGDFDD